MRVALGRSKQFSSLLDSKRKMDGARQAFPPIPYLLLPPNNILVANVTGGHCVVVVAAAFFDRAKKADRGVASL